MRRDPIMRSPFQAVLASYAEIFFLRSRVVGAVIFAITLLDPNVALCGLLAVIGAYGLARLIRMNDEFLGSGFYTYNPLLVGMTLGCMFRISPLLACLVLLAGAVAFMATVALTHVLSTYFRLPILSLPFAIVSTTLFLAAARYNHALGAPPPISRLVVYDPGLPAWIAGYFRSFGAILFAPSVLVGMAFSAIVLCSSRILFLLSVLGYYTGVALRGWLLSAPDAAFTDVNSFNFILIAMAVGGVFLVPSLSSYLLALIAVAVSTVLLDALTSLWSLHGIPAFTLPFNFVSLGMIYVLGLVGYPLIATRIGATPEETLEDHLANRLRYPGQERTLFLPFAGAWSVWQAFDGPWTHKGAWRCAYDFVITDEKGKTFSGAGDRLEDYYCYKKPVLSPVRGRVIRVVDELEDGQPGKLERTNNWGNVVVLQDLRGFFVGISHFAAKSIQVKPGDWVERGTVLGLCGNSGYSPQPHIHVQVQATDAVGAGSLPFSFVSYFEAGHYHANALPAEGAKVEPLYADKALESVTTFLLDEVHHFEVLRGGERVDRLTLTVRMAADGTHYFESPRGRLYFGKHEGTLYFYRVEGKDPWLRAMFLALPRLPLAHRDNLAWSDYVPVGLATSGVRRAAVRFLSSFHGPLGRVAVSQAFMGRKRVRTVVQPRLLGPRIDGEVVLDEVKGFASIRLGSLELRRVEA